MTRIFDGLQTIWRAVPNALRRPAAGIVSRLVIGFAIRRQRVAKTLPLPGPIIVSGFFSEVLGIGRAGELTASALEKAGYDVIRHDIRPLLHAQGFRSHTLPGPPNCVWILHCNPPEALVAMARLRPESMHSHYRIGYWAWELPLAPKKWIKASRHYQEVWAPSQFTADSLRGTVPKAKVMPHPVPDLSGIASERARFNLPEGGTVVLTMADLRSSAVRKNPFAAIDAYLMAFPIPGTTTLVVKIVSSQDDSESYISLQERVSGRSDIRLMTDLLSDVDQNALMASSDIVISLHRSEGFGLTLAEAMSLGKAVIFTGWSGNMEFMAGLPCGGVKYSFVPVEDRTGVYPLGQMWAEADIADASKILQKLEGDASLRFLQGKAGQAAIARCRDAWRHLQLHAPSDSIQQVLK